MTEWEVAEIGPERRDDTALAQRDDLYGRTFNSADHRLHRPAGIGCLADVRTVPRSRYNPQFNSETLGEALHAEGIDYVSLRALGGLRHPRKDSANGGWRNDGFRGYADYMQTDEFVQGLDELIALTRRRRIAIMCAEAVPWRCHRSLVADALSVRGIPVIEILSIRDWREHKLTSFAHVEGTAITYPPEQGSLF